MKKKRTLKKIILFIVILSLSINIFCLPGLAQEFEPIENVDVLKYNGTIEELPQPIYEAYNKNPKAESLDIYDKNLYSFTTNNIDDTKTTEIFQAPIKYIENNEIKFIDTTIKEVSVVNKLVTDKHYVCSNTPVKSYFPDNLSDGISIEKEGYSIKCYPVTEKIFDLEKVFSKATLSDNNELMYENVFSSSDIVTYTPISTGVKEEIILYEYNGNNTFEFTIELENLEPLYLAGDSIPLIDVKTGEQTAAISQIDIKDSAIEYKTSLYNKIEIEKNKVNSYTLRLIIDKDFLESESTVYPVIIDPTITFYSGPIYDAPVFSGYPNTNFNANTYNIVGYHGSTYGEGTAFIKLDALQNCKEINQANVTSAYLRVYEGSGKTSTATVNLFNCMEIWDNTTITYNSTPTLAQTAYSSKTISSSGWYEFNITNLLRGWMKYEVQDGGKSQHHGVALKMSTTGVPSRHFASATNSSYPPSIIVNYTPDTSLVTGNYFIRSKYRPDNSKPYCFLQASSDLSNLVQYTPNGYAKQTWSVKHLGNGFYELYSKKDSSKAIGVSSTIPNNGTNVGLYSSSAGNRIKFKIIKNTDGTYRIMSACASNNMALSIAGPSQAVNTNIQTNTYSGDAHQRWTFYRAAPQGKLTYWHSDSNMISYHTNKNLKVCVEKTSGYGKTLSTLKSYVEYGLDSWSDLGITYTFTDSPSECNIYVKGITRDEAINLGFKNHLISGATTNPGETGTTSTYKGYAYSPEGWKKIYSLSRKEVYIIWDTTDDGSVKNSNYSTLRWKVITAHEIGHALGYEGHYATESLMSAFESEKWAQDNSTPSNDNLKHLQQMY